MAMAAASSRLGKTSAANIAPRDVQADDQIPRASLDFVGPRVPLRPGQASTVQPSAASASQSQRPNPRASLPGLRL